MKVVAAIDSFKGSMTSMEAGNAAKAGVLAAKPEAEVIVKPLADGGEGTTDALVEGFGGEKVTLTVTGPLGKPVKVYYGIIPEKETAVIEMASAAGIILVSEEEKNPLKATTYGVGEMIKDAIAKGYREFIVGIGGSATNDGGVGMLQALGFSFFDKNKNVLGQGAEILGEIAFIDCKKALAELSECHFQVACDVTSPLCGELGATYVFGPQKGVTEELKDLLDQAMNHYAEISAECLKKDVSKAAGTGAAGGLGYAFSEFLNADLTPGINLILKAIELEKDIENADIVITGEGMLDRQTAMGKVPIGVAKMAKKHGAKVVAFAGGVTKDAAACNEAGIDAFFPIIRGITTLADAMVNENAKANMQAAVEQVFRIF